MAVRAYIFLFLSVTGAAEGFFSDWLPDANNLEEYNPVEYPTTQSNLFEDLFLFANEDYALTFQDQIPLDINSLNPSWDLFADTSDDCSDVLVSINRNRLKRREGTVCAAAKKKTRKSRLEIPTLQETEAQLAAGAARESNQPQCPPKLHPETVETVYNSGDPNDEGNSAVYEGALILVNCERRTSDLSFSFVAFIHPISPPQRLLHLGVCSFSIRSVEKVRVIS